MAAAALTLGPVAHPARSEVVQRGGVRVVFDGKLSPHALPRHGAAPVAISVRGRIKRVSATKIPQLRGITIAINRHGRLDYRGLPFCTIRRLQPSTSRDALRVCGGALVGHGWFSANVVLPGQSPFPSAGRVLAFNGRQHGRPVILAHVYGTRPAPTSAVIPFAIHRSGGAFGTTLTASLPGATSDWGFVTGLSVTLSRRFRDRGRRRSFLSAGCPAPQGFPGALFPLARASFRFAGGRTVSSTLVRSCDVRGRR